MVNPKKARLSKEVEEIKRLKDINKILKIGDLENALLSNAAKDSESLNDNVLDSLLQGAGAEKTNDKGLEVLQRLITKTGGAEVLREKRVKVSRSRGKIKVKRVLHMVKRKGSGKKAKRSKKKR